MTLKVVKISWLLIIYIVYSSIHLWPLARCPPGNNLINYLIFIFLVPVTTTMGHKTPRGRGHLIGNK